MTKRPMPAAPRLIASLGSGVIIGSLVAWAAGPPLGLLCGLTTQATVFVLLGVFVLWPLDAHQTNLYREREVLPPKVTELLIVLLSGGAIAGIVILQVVGGLARDVAAGIGLLGVFMNWAMLHLMYAVRYSELYYATPAGGIDFNSDEPPAYRDFFYFSYNLGMTYQVSDTSVTTSAIRAVVLRHCLLAYLFGTVILAGTINLVAAVFMR